MDPADNGGGTGNENADTGSGEFTAITTQEQLNQLVGERVARERAKFADYKDLQAKAKRLDDIEAANATELEKASKRAAEAEAARDDAHAAATRLRVAIAHGITVEDADLFLTGRDEETLTAQAKRLQEREAGRKKQGNYVPREGYTPKTPGADDERAAVRSLFGAAG